MRRSTILVGIYIFSCLNPIYVWRVVRWDPCGFNILSFFRLLLMKIYCERCFWTVAFGSGWQFAAFTEMISSLAENHLRISLEFHPRGVGNLQQLWDRPSVNTILHYLQFASIHSPKFMTKLSFWRSVSSITIWNSERCRKV